MALIVGPDGRAPEVELEVIHPARAQGRIDGRAQAGKDEIFEQVVEAGLGCVLDETYPESVREKAGENVLGFAEGWAEMMQVTPMQFLTRQQTARVLELPRPLRRAWLSEYKKGCRHWARGGGAISGKRPVLPEIP